MSLPSIPDPAISQSQTAGATTAIAQGLGAALPVAGKDLTKLTASAGALTALATAASAAIPVAGEVMIGTQLLAAGIQAGDQVIAFMNTPQMQAARRNAEVMKILAQMDADLLAAQKSGDISKIDKEASA